MFQIYDVVLLCIIIKKLMIKYILGVAANKTCNADNALKVGQQIIDSMTGCSVKDFVFKKNKQAILRSSKSLKTEESKHLEPSLLFQRIIFLVDNKRQNINKLEVFKNELCHFPTDF
jgi:hypothetical protein